MTVALALGGRVTRARTSSSTSSLCGARACACACDLVFGRQPAFPLRRRFLVSPGPSSGKRLETVCVNPPLNAMQHRPHHLPRPSRSTLCVPPSPPLGHFRPSRLNLLYTRATRHRVVLSPPTVTSFIPCVVVPVPDDVCEPCHGQGYQVTLASPNMGARVNSSLDDVVQLGI